MVRLSLDCSDEDILAVAEKWTNRLVAEDYDGAWAMLLHRPAEVWAPTPDALAARIRNCGCEAPTPSEALRVTPTATATGERWRRLPALSRTADGDTYRGPAIRGRLDWQLPLNGEWSDLVASFDLLEHDGELVFALAALRVP
jgi:hypothetical protein